VLQGSLVGSGTDVGEYASLLMGANVGSACTIGERAYVATGAVVADGVRVGRGRSSAPERSRRRTCPTA